MIFRPLAGAGAGKSLPGGMDNAVHPLRAARPSGVATQLQRKIPEVFSGIFLCCASTKTRHHVGPRWTRHGSYCPFQLCPVPEASRFPGGKRCHTRGRRRAQGQFFMTRTVRFFHDAASPLRKMPAPHRGYTPYSLSLRHRDAQRWVQRMCAHLAKAINAKKAASLRMQP